MERELQRQAEGDAGSSGGPADNEGLTNTRDYRGEADRADQQLDAALDRIMGLYRSGDIVNRERPVTAPLDPNLAVRIDTQAPWWPGRIYMGRETEFVPVGARAGERGQAAGQFLAFFLQHLPHVPHRPEGEGLDEFTPLGRGYLELSEFMEVAGPTCQSPAALAWAYEACLAVLADANVIVRGRAVVLCHVPSDYGGLDGQAASHSTGCHLNLLCPRPLEHDEFVSLANLIIPLNCVFGPGGLGLGGGRAPRFSCDPRADHVRVLIGEAAHGERPKPLFMLRDEPFAGHPRMRLQITGFGGPRSPVSNFLQAALLALAIEAIVAGKNPPWSLADPLDALRADSNDTVATGGRAARRARLPKWELAERACRWLRAFAASGCTDAAAMEQVVWACDLAAASARAAAGVEGHAPSWPPGRPKPPVLPVDVAIKRLLFDRIARRAGFDSLADLCARFGADPTGQPRLALERVVLADAFFNTPCRVQSTYELAIRAGLFVRPQFDCPTEMPGLSLPHGICHRDRCRARLMTDPAVRSRLAYCDWDHVYTNAGTALPMPDPWSELAGV